LDSRLFAKPTFNFWIAFCLTRFIRRQDTTLNTARQTIHPVLECRSQKNVRIQFKIFIREARKPKRLVKGFLDMVQAKSQGAGQPTLHQGLGCPDPGCSGCTDA